MPQQTVKTNDRNVPLNRIRNIGIIAHIDAGKTTTSERIQNFGCHRTRLRLYGVGGHKITQGRPSLHPFLVPCRP
jgi:hypothetical protein